MKGSNGMITYYDSLGDGNVNGKELISKSRRGTSTFSDQGEVRMAGLKHATPRLRPGDHAVT